MASGWTAMLIDACFGTPATEAPTGAGPCAPSASPRNELSRSMAVDRRALLRFMTLYVALFSAFGFASPFLPAFLAGRGLGPEELGFVLSAATALPDIDPWQSRCSAAWQRHGRIQTVGRTLAMGGLHHQYFRT